MEIGTALKRMNQKYYNPRNREILPGLAQLLFGFYKILGPAKPLINRVESSKVLREILIEESLSEEQKNLRNSLAVEVIRQRAERTDPQSLAAEIKEELTRFLASFSSEKIVAVNGNNNQLAIFIEVIHFDYYMVLKRFDTGMAENNFAYKPRFEAIGAEQMLDELKDFNDLLLGIDKDTHWDLVFGALKKYRKAEIIPRSAWEKAFIKILALRKSGVLTMIIRHISRDPFYKPRPMVYREKLFDQYLSTLRTKTELTVQKIAQEKRSKNIDELAREVFGTAVSSKMKNYTEPTGSKYASSGISGFLHTGPINYIWVFLTDFAAKDLKELTGILLIKGKWATAESSRQLSDPSSELMLISESIRKFDESLAEEQELGRRLKALFSKAGKDKRAVPQCRALIEEINDAAKEIARGTCQNLVILGKAIKTVLEDSQKEHPELIINWSEINSITENRVTAMIVDIYKKIYYFLKLLKCF